MRLLAGLASGWARRRAWCGGWPCTFSGAGQVGAVEWLPTTAACHRLSPVRRAHCLQENRRIDVIHVVIFSELGGTLQSWRAGSGRFSGKLHRIDVCPTILIDRS